MNESQTKLLAKGILVLPYTLDHSTYELLLEALVIERPAQAVRLYCKGSGGSTAAMAAMVDLIEQHGNCVGVLVGEADSSHVPLWAACARRYVSPHGSIGIHKVTWSIGGEIDSAAARQIAADCERTERIASDLLGRISGKPSAYWYDMIQEAGSGACKLIDAAKLIALGMARPLRELDAALSSTERSA